ncbi:MAG: SDR family NAD(P)-dependent oxidoreductase [Clostridia bacterium]
MKYAFVTGSCGGLADITIQELLRCGYTVFAGDKLNQTDTINGNRHDIPLDVTDQTNIEQCVQYCKQFTDKLDIVINFAGIVRLGSLIENADKLTQILNINVVGMYLVNKALFELVRNAKGRYINISSEYGKLDAVPFHTYYTLAKHGVEVYNDGLRRELQFFNIPVIAIRPGAFATAMQGSIVNQFDTLLLTTNYYVTPLLKMKKMMENELKRAKHPEIFLKTMRKALFSKHPKIYYNVGNSLKMKLLSVLPAKLQDKIFKLYFLKNKNK